MKTVMIESLHTLIKTMIGSFHFHDLQPLTCFFFTWRHAFLLTYCILLQSTWDILKFTTCFYIVSLREKSFILIQITYHISLNCKWKQNKPLNEMCYCCLIFLTVHFLLWSLQSKPLLGFNVTQSITPCTLHGPSVIPCG